MSDFTASFLTRETPRLKAFFRPFAEFLEGIREARAMAARYETLSRLSDGELAQRGLSRHDIPRVVVTGRGF
jgi:uncharacterized protein YjiS (DUF1127 family)